MSRFAHALDRRGWTLVFGGVVVAIGVGLATFAVYPQFEAWREAQKNYAVLAAALDRGDELAFEIESLTREVAGLGQELHGSTSQMPRNQLEAYVMGRMQNVAWRHDIELESIRPGDGTRVSVFDEILFDVKVSGRYFDLYGWLQDLDEELGFVVVRRFNLNPKGEASADPVLEASLTMVAYREAPDAA